VCGRGLVLFGLLAAEPKLQDKEPVMWLFLTWSTIEMIRYCCGFDNWSGRYRIFTTWMSDFLQTPCSQNQGQLSLQSPVQENRGPGWLAEVKVASNTVIPYGRWCSIALRRVFHKELYVAFNLIIFYWCCMAILIGQKMDMLKHIRLWNNSGWNGN